MDKGGKMEASSYCIHFLPGSSEAFHNNQSYRAFLCATCSSQYISDLWKQNYLRTIDEAKGVLSCFK